MLLILEVHLKIVLRLRNAYLDSTSFKHKSRFFEPLTADVTTVDSTSFKYKSRFFKPLTADDNEVFKDVKIAVPLTYLGNVWRSLEMPLTNCKIHLESNWTKDYAISTIADTTFKIANTKLYFPIVTLSNKDNVKLVKLLEKEFKRPVYWNEYQTKIEARN